MEKQIKEAVRIAQKLGYSDIAGRMQKEWEQSRTKSYKIAVAGEFKTGKSTLINRLFLKQDLLFTDIMEATAVPVEIAYGTEKYLEIYPYAAPLPEEDFSEDFSLTSLPPLQSGEGKPIRLAHPSPKDIQIHTSAESPEARAQLARKTARVKLCWPSPNLEGLRIFDTPGINSLNEAVISGTFRILPRADLLLFVTGAKQLSNTEREFLSSRIFLQGITRFMLIISYDSAWDNKNSGQKESLKKSIQGQLKNLGYENVPVEFFDIRRPSPAVSPESMREKINREIFPKAEQVPEQTADDVIAQLLGEKKSGDKSPDAEPGNRDRPPCPRNLEERIISFIRDNVRPGRQEKTGHVFRQQIRLLLLRCNAELSSLRKSESKRRQLCSEMQAREARVHLQYEVLTGEFTEEIRRVRKTFLQNADEGIRQIGEKWIQHTKACGGLAEMQKSLKNAQLFIHKDMEKMLLDATGKAGEDLSEIIREYGMKSRILLDPWQSEVSRGLEIDGGILAKIPPFAVLGLDMMLFVRFGPFGPLADILIRLLLHYIPLLNKAMPASLAGSLLKKKIRSSLQHCMDQIRRELPEMLGPPFDSLAEKLREEWQEYAENQMKAVRESAESLLAEPPDKERQLLLHEMQRKAELLIKD